MSGTMKKASCSEYGCCPEPYYCTQPPPPCFPSICDVSKSMNCHLSTDSNGSDTACPPYGTHQPYGRNRPPPCGLGMTSNDCSSCCWDTTLCFPTAKSQLLVVPSVTVMVALLLRWDDSSSVAAWPGQHSWTR